MGVGPNYAEEAINVTTAILKSPIDGVQIVSGRPWRYVFGIRCCSHSLLLLFSTTRCAKQTWINYSKRCWRTEEKRLKLYRRPVLLSKKGLQAHSFLLFHSVAINNKLGLISDVNLGQGLYKNCCRPIHFIYSFLKQL